MKQPNIVFFFSDQQRADTLGCYGQRLPVTPNLDRLASEGVRYEWAFTCQPVCGPARACLQTGLYATQIGCFVNGISLAPGTQTLAHRLGGAGYQTAYVGKWHLASDTRAGVNHYEISAIPPERRGGYEYWVASDVLEFTSHGYDGYMHDGGGRKVEFTGYRTDCVTDQAVHFLQNRDRGRPFFLFLSHIEPHHQNDRGRYEGPDGSKERWRGFDEPCDLLCGDFEGDWKENYPDYLGCCHALDRNVGKVVDTLREQGVYDDTVFIYTSDHGSHFHTRLGEYKRNCFDGCLRIPMIIRGGAFLGGRVESGAPVSLIHLPPTILRAAGVPVPGGMAGRPLQEMGGGWEDAAYFEISESYVGRGLRTLRYTYCVAAPGLSGETDSHSMRYEDKYLFDNLEDPCQSRNLVGDGAYRAVRNMLCDKLRAKIQEVEGRAVEIAPAG